MANPFNIDFATAMANPSNIDFATDPYFEKADWFWPKVRPGCIPVARNQRCANICFAFPVLDSIYAEYSLNNPGKVVKILSAQELLDCLHLKFPLSDPTKWEEYSPETTGYPNSYRNAFEYIRTEGVYMESQYPFVGHVKRFERPMKNPELKVKIKNYHKIALGRHDLVVKQLHVQPVVGRILFAPSLIRFGGDGVYKGPTEDEASEIDKAIKDGKPIPYHALLILGYGSEGGDEYYIGQGYWGQWWCHLGFIKILRGLITRVFYPEKTCVTRVEIKD